MIPLLKLDTRKRGWGREKRVAISSSPVSFESFDVCSPWEWKRSSLKDTKERWFVFTQINNNKQTLEIFSVLLESGH
jgi:hypothetical protein